MTSRLRGLPGCLLAWVLTLLAVGAARADEADAIKFVKKHDGTVKHDNKAKGKPVVAVNLSDTNVRDAGLKSLAPFHALEKLDLSGTNVKGPGLKELARFKKLRTLHLNDTYVTNEDMKEIAKLTHLKELGLAATEVGNAGLKELHALKNLELLCLGETKVNKEGINALRKALPRCKVDLEPYYDD